VPVCEVKMLFLNTPRSITSLKFLTHLYYRTILWRFVVEVRRGRKLGNTQKPCIEEKPALVDRLQTRLLVYSAVSTGKKVSMFRRIEVLSSSGSSSNRELFWDRFTRKMKAPRSFETFIRIYQSTLPSNQEDLHLTSSPPSKPQS
jgi:hypothetical protein